MTDAVSTAAPPSRAPTVSHCPARQRPLLPAAPSFLPRPASRAPRQSSLSVRDTRPRAPAGRRAPGPGARGPGVGVEGPISALAARDALPGHPPGGAEPSGGGAGCPPRGSRSRPALPAAAAAAVTTGRSREQRFPPRRSAASDRPYTARELSPTPLPASVAPSLPPPSVAGSRASAQRRPRPGPWRRGWATPRLGAAPTAGSPGSPRQPSPAGPRPAGSRRWSGRGWGWESWETPGSGNPKPRPQFSHL